MARAPRFTTPEHNPPASGWKPGHRAPAMGYGQLNGCAISPQDGVSRTERDASFDSDNDADDYR